MSLLNLNNVEVAYDRVFLAIKGVSLEVQEGSVVALLGANGAGKSTTLKTVSGLLAPERGEVRRGEVHFMGQDIAHLSPPERVHMLLDSKANWVQVPDGPHDVRLDTTPEESLEDWHRRHGLLDGDVPA